jgi:plastocyanin
MKRSELLSRSLSSWQLSARSERRLYLWSRTPIIHARMAESGGWNPDVIQAEAGKPLHLKLTSDDVVHGFAVGQMDMEAVDVQPGKVTDITLTFDKPGIYTFYCTRWCGLNHWRMRGTIEVTGTSDPEPVHLLICFPSTLTLTLRTILQLFQTDNRQQLTVSHWQRITQFAIISEDYFAHNRPIEVFDDLKNTSLTG